MSPFATFSMPPFPTFCLDLAAGVRLNDEVDLSGIVGIGLLVVACSGVLLWKANQADKPAAVAKENASRPARENTLSRRTYRRTERTEEQKKADEERKLAEKENEEEKIKADEEAKKKKEEAKKKADEEAAAAEAKKRESAAQAKLDIAKEFSNRDTRIRKLKEVIEKYPETEAAKEAAKFLKRESPP